MDRAFRSLVRKIDLALPLLNPVSERGMEES